MTEHQFIIECLQRLDDKSYRVQRLIDRLDETPGIYSAHLRAAEGHIDTLIDYLTYLLEKKP